MDNLVEETIVKTTVDYSTDEKKGKFIRLNSREVGTLCDDENKDVIQDSGELKLQAVTLKGGHCGRKVRFKLSRYVNSCVSPGDGETVRLSITNTNLHISCSMKDGRPALNLEECSREKLQEISGDENRFLFFKRFNGTISIVTLESVKCPGWFISTCHEVENQPVEMCEPDTIRRIMRFKLN
ncbi:interleukin-1 beta [Symphorus nematophorus]